MFDIAGQKRYYKHQKLNWTFSNPSVGLICCPNSSEAAKHCSHSSETTLLTYMKLRNPVSSPIWSTTPTQRLFWRKHSRMLSSFPTKNPPSFVATFNSSANMIQGSPKHKFHPRNPNVSAKPSLMVPSACNASSINTATRNGAA